jgi:hypothetical protein
VSRAHRGWIAALAVTVALLASACVRPAGTAVGGAAGPRTGGDSIPPLPGGTPPTATGRRTVPRPGPYDEAYVEARIIASKTAPITLYASGGEWCEVTEARFRELKVGDRVTCAWHIVVR